MLTAKVLHAAANNDWQTVFSLLEFNKQHFLRRGSFLIDFSMSAPNHPQRFRLYDFATLEGVELGVRLKLYQYGVRPSYDLEVFRFAQTHNWVQVFNTLTLNIQKNGALLDINARNPLHEEGFGLFEYAEVDDKGSELRQTLWQMGARPCYEAKAFSAAKKGDWKTVFSFFEQGLIDIHAQNSFQPLCWTFLDYAIKRGDYHAINHLMINLGVKETTYVPPVAQVQATPRSAAAVTSLPLTPSHESTPKKQSPQGQQQQQFLDTLPVRAPQSTSTNHTLPFLDAMPVQFLDNPVPPPIVFRPLAVSRPHLLLRDGTTLALPMSEREKAKIFSPHRK